MADCTIKLKINDRTVFGRVSHLSEQDLSVEIKSPYNNGITNSRHMPYFAVTSVSFMKNGKPTEYAHEESMELLRELYHTCVAVDNNRKKILTLLGDKTNLNLDENYDAISRLIGVDVPQNTLESVLKGLL